MIDPATAGILAAGSAGVDWFRVVVGLERAGLSQAAIGHAIGRSQAQVNAYKSIPGTEPSFTVGLALLVLWREYAESGRAIPTLAGSSGRQSGT